MNFRIYPAMLAVFFLVVLVVIPVHSAENMTGVISQMAGANKTVIVNQTADLMNDTGSRDYNYGVQSISLSRYDDAIRFFDQALAENLTMMKKTDALLYLFQGKAFAQIQLGNFTGAAATADEGLAYYPKDPMLWNNKGWALQNINRNDDALVAYTRAVSFDGNYTNALLNQGNLLNQMGRYQDAAAAFDKANETDPFNVPASDGLAVAKSGMASSGRTTTIILIIVLIAVAGVIVWYVKIRKPAEPAPEEKKKPAKKK